MEEKSLLKLLENEKEAVNNVNVAYTHTYYILDYTSSKYGKVYDDMLKEALIEQEKAEDALTSARREIKAYFDALENI